MNTKQNITSTPYKQTVRRRVHALATSTAQWATQHGKDMVQNFASVEIVTSHAFFSFCLFFLHFLDTEILNLYFKQFYLNSNYIS